MPGGASSIRSRIDPAIVLPRRRLPRRETVEERIDGLAVSRSRTCERRSAHPVSRTRRFAAPPRTVRLVIRALRPSTSPSECAGSVDSSSTRRREPPRPVERRRPRHRSSCRRRPCRRTSASRTSDRKPRQLSSDAPARRLRLDAQRGDARRLRQARPTRPLRAQCAADAGERRAAAPASRARPPRGRRAAERRPRNAAMRCARIAPGASHHRHGRSGGGVTRFTIRRARPHALPRASRRCASSVSSSAIGSGSVTQQIAVASRSRSSAPALPLFVNDSRSMRPRRPASSRPRSASTMARCLACMWSNTPASALSSAGIPSSRSVWPVGAVSTTTWS